MGYLAERDRLETPNGATTIAMLFVLRAAIAIDGSGCSELPGVD